MEIILDILKKSIIPAIITASVALGVVVLHRLARAFSKKTHTVLTLGTCTRVDNASELDFESGEVREIKNATKAVFKVNINGQEMEVKHNASANNMPIRVGDVVEILVDPNARTYIYSDNGYREYKRLRRERGYKKSWPIFFIFFFIFVMMWIVINLRQKDPEIPEDFDMPVCEEMEGMNAKVCHPRQ